MVAYWILSTIKMIGIKGIKLLLWYSHTHLSTDCILQKQEKQIRPVWVTHVHTFNKIRITVWNHGNGRRIVMKRAMKRSDMEYVWTVYTNSMYLYRILTVWQRTPTVPLGIDSKADGQQLSQVVLGSDPGNFHHCQGANRLETHPEEIRWANHCDLYSTENTVNSMNVNILLTVCYLV